MATFTAQQLAVAFAREIREALTPAQLTEANRLNDAEPGGAQSNKICHTHDHIDANECMIAALASLGAPEDFGLGDTDEAQAQMDIINQAWAIAKLSHFTLTEGHGPVIDVPIRADGKREAGLVNADLDANGDLVIPAAR